MKLAFDSRFAPIRTRTAVAIVALALAATACSSATADDTIDLASEVTGPPATTTAPTTQPAPVAAPYNEVASYERLYDTSDSCADVGLIASDGLTDFATVDGLLISRNLTTGETAEHGLAPTSCAVWIGDEQAGLRWATAADQQQMWFGPSDGPWTVDKTWDAPVRLVKSQYTTANRLVFVDDADRAFLVDGATGEMVGTPVGGGRFSSVDNSRQSNYVAIGYAVSGEPEGNGRLFIIDDRTGETLYHVNSELPAVALVFDDAAGELIAGLAGGNIITIDLARGEIVAEVETTAKTSLLDIGIRPDGTIVAVSNGQVELVDRRTGGLGTTDLSAGHSARILPDGTPLILTFDGLIKVYAAG